MFDENLDGCQTDVIAFIINKCQMKNNYIEQKHCQLKYECPLELLTYVNGNITVYVLAHNNVYWNNNITVDCIC